MFLLMVKRSTRFEHGGRHVAARQHNNNTKGKPMPKLTTTTPQQAAKIANLKPTRANVRRVCEETFGGKFEVNVDGPEVIDVEADAPDGYVWKCDELHFLVGHDEHGPRRDVWQDMLDRMSWGVEVCPFGTCDCCGWGVVVDDLDGESLADPILWKHKLDDCTARNIADAVPTLRFLIHVPDASSPDGRRTFAQGFVFGDPEGVVFLADQLGGRPQYMGHDGKWYGNAYEAEWCDVPNPPE